ncbi:MAG: nicotinamide riboside transporter PnuC [Paludibacter sp.]|jgi:nicotinamide mononucleotide transporter|nr:nicotinamide riboside transporter PnuC [Paludibacter sp.]
MSIITALEITGTLFSFIYLYLSVKQKIGLWVFGFLSAVVYSLVFFETKFYAAMSLQLYYLWVSVYGWYSWKKKRETTGEDLPVRYTHFKEWTVLSGITMLVMLIYYAVLSMGTDSPVPGADSFITAFSITATWMLARKQIEHWLIWIVVDSVAVFVYLKQGLYSTALLFVVYGAMAVVGWIQWRKSMKKQTVRKQD